MHSHIWQRFLWTIVISSIAIVSDIYALANRECMVVCLWGQTTIIAINGVAVIVCIALSIYMLRPRAILYEANKITREFISKDKNEGETIEGFIHKFVELEITLKSICRKLGFPVQNSSTRFQILSLFGAGIIDSEQRSIILKALKLRNSVTHEGSIEKIDKSFFNAFADTINKLKQL